MATRSLPNPSFGNDPATLLGSLIVEIGELAELQKDTTARIENLDENEDRSTTLIEDAIRDDIKEGIKRTDTLKDLTKGTLKNISDIKKVSDEERALAKKDTEARMNSFEEIKRMRSEMSLSDKRKFFTEQAMMEVKNFFDGNNADGINKVFDNLVDGIGNTFTRGATSGTNQLKRGFDNLTDGMGALGPVINAFKTGLSKAGAVVDIAVGSFRAVGQAFSATKSMLGGFFGVDRPENELEKALTSGDAVLESETAAEPGDAKNPIFVDFTDNALDALHNVLSGGLESTPIGMEKTGNGIFVPKGTKKEMLEQKKFRRESLKNIKEQRTYRRGTPRAFLYLGGIILVLAVLLNAIKSFFEKGEGFFGPGNRSAYTGSLAGILAGAQRTLFATTGELDDPLPDRNILKKTAQAGVSKGRPRKTASIRGFTNTATPGTTLSPKQFLDPSLQKLVEGDAKTGIKGMYNMFNPGARKMSAGQIMVDGKLTEFGEKLTAKERLKIGGVGFLRFLPVGLAVTDVGLTTSQFMAANQVLDDIFESKMLLKYDDGQARAMSKEEYDFLKAQLQVRLTGQVAGGAAGLYTGLAAGSGLAALLVPGPDTAAGAAFGGGLPGALGSYLLRLGAVVLGSGAVAYTTDQVVSSGVEAIGMSMLDDEGMRFSLDNLEGVKFVEPVDVAGNISGTADETKVIEGEIQGAVAGANNFVVDAQDNSSNTSFIDQRPPADDEGLKESEKERSSYFGGKPFPGL